jgi:hypothetical protein
MLKYKAWWRCIEAVDVCPVYDSALKQLDWIAQLSPQK